MLNIESIVCRIALPLPQSGSKVSVPVMWEKFVGNSSPHFGGHWCVFFKVDWRSKLGNMGRKRDCYVSFRDSTHLDTSLLKVNLRQIYVLTVNCCYNRASQTNVHVGLRQGKKLVDILRIK